MTLWKKPNLGVLISFFFNHLYFDYNTNMKLLTVILLNITHSITMLSLQHKTAKFTNSTKIKIHDIYS